MAAEPTVSRATRAGVTCYVVDVRTSLLIVAACGAGTTRHDVPADDGRACRGASPACHHVAERRSSGSVLLVARRHAQRSRGARLPHRRGELRHRQARTGQAARSHTVRPSCARTSRPTTPRCPSFTTATSRTRSSHPGQEQPVVARKKGSLDAAEEVVLDANELARGHAFYQLAEWTISRDVTTSRGPMTSSVVANTRSTSRTLATGKTLADTAHDISPTLEWANDQRDAVLRRQGPDDAARRPRAAPSPR